MSGIEIKRGKSRGGARALWLTGTALGCSLLVQPAAALAANECGPAASGVVTCPAPTTTGVSYTTIDDLILNLPASASNTGAIAVDVVGGAGDIGVVAADIATSGNQAPGLFVTTTSGAIDIEVTKAATSGTDMVNDMTNDAIVALSDSGAVKVKAGEVSTAGVYTSGVAAQSKTGDVTVEIDKVTSSGLGGSIVLARSLDGPSGAPTGGGKVTVVVGEASTTQPNGVIGAIGFGDVSVTAGKVVATGSPAVGPAGHTSYGQGIGARSYNGDVSVKVDELSTSGVGFLGVSANAFGDATVESETVTTASDGAYGIYVKAGGAAKVTADTTTTHGAVTYDTAVHYTDAIRVEAAGLMDITSQHASATGDGGSAIVARGDGAIKIVSGEASATGGGITAGGVQVFSNAISAQSFLGGIDITSDKASAGGAQSWAIYASAANGAINIDSGTATAAGAGGRAIYANGGGGVTIKSDVASTTGGPSASNAADAIMALTFNKTANIDITSGAASTTGTNARGIYAWTNTGDVVIDSGQVTTTGANAHGIMVDADGLLVYGTPHAPGGGTGVLSIVSDKVSATGAGSTGIWVDHAGPISIDSGEITVGNGVGLYVYGQGAVDVSADKVMAGGTGVVVYGREGAVHVTTGSVSAGTTGDVGVFAQSTTGDIVVSAGVTRTANLGMNGAFTADGVGALSTGGGHVVVNSVDSAVVGQYATAVWGQSTGGVVEINSGKARASSANTLALFGRGDQVTIVSEDVEIVGASSRAIQALADNGDVTATSGRAVAKDANSVAIDLYASHDANLTVTGETVGGLSGVRVSALNRAEVTVGADASITALGGAGIEFRAVPVPGGAGSPAAGYGASLTTAGHIGGSGAIAVKFAGGDDTLTQLTGASFAGAVDGGAGLDSLVLKGTSSQQTADQTFGDIVGFETTKVETGDWTLSGLLQTDSIAIASGATLRIDDKQDRNAWIETTTPGTGLSVRNDGALVYQSYDDNLYADSGTLSINGTGDVELNSGAMLASGAWTYTGVTRVNGGELHVATDIGGGLEQTGGVVVVGASYVADDAGLGTVKVAGPGASGGFAGDIKVDGGLFFLGRAGDYELTNALSGAGGEVIWAGGGDLTLSGVYSRTGLLTNDGGLVTIADLSADSRLALKGDAFALGSGAKKTGGLSGDADLDIGAGTLTIAQANASSYSGDLTGAGGLTKSGAATLALSGAATYAGPTTVSGGKLLLTGSMSSDVTVASGATLQIGDGGTTGALTGDLAIAGTAVFNRSDEYDFGGDITGAGELVKLGASRLTLSGQYGFTGTTTVQGGSVRILHLPQTAEVQVDNGVLDLSGLTQTITNLSGGATGEVDIDGGALTVNQSGSTTFAGAITGSGSFTITGGGVIELTGANTYTGPTTVGVGKLKVNGSVTSDVTVGASGALGGSGTIGGDVVVQSGGQVTPGNSPGTLTVAGDFTFTTGSTYQVEVLPTGEHDLIVVGGATTIQTGANVAVLAGGPASQYARLTQYGILTSAGGITGRFSGVTSDMAFLTPSLTYTANAVRLNLLRNDIRFASFATTPNQAQVAAAAEALGLGAPVYDALVTQNAAGSVQAYNALDGQIHADVSTVLAGEAGRLREAILARSSASADVAGGWGDVLAGWSHVDAGAGAAGLKVSGSGLVVGGDRMMGDTRLGLAAAYGEGQARVSARGSRAESTGGQVAAYAATTFGPLRANLGGAYAWSSVDAERVAQFPGVVDRLKGKYDATVGQLFGQVSAPVALAATSVEPFVSASYLRVKSDDFSETGGFTALKVDGVTRELGVIDIGVKVKGEMGLGSAVVLRPRGAVAWRMTTGDLAGETSNAFAGGTTRFVVSGAKYDAGALAVQLGVDLVSGDRARFGVTYEGTYGDRYEAQAIRAGGAWRF
jgi:outer membrane autotransporter protein